VHGERRALRFRVLRELMAGFNAERPAPGTDDYYRMCVPYPVELALSAAEAAADYTLHVGGITDYAYFSPGALALGRPCTPCCALNVGVWAGTSAASPTMPTSRRARSPWVALASPAAP
jgi:hypothetical protein